MTGEELDLCQDAGTMTSADFCRVHIRLSAKAAVEELPLRTAPRQISPDKNNDFHPSPATYTSRPFGDYRTSL